MEPFKTKHRSTCYAPIFEIMFWVGVKRNAARLIEEVIDLNDNPHSRQQKPFDPTAFDPENLEIIDPKDLVDDGVTEKIPVTEEPPPRRQRDPQPARVRRTHR
jgi:hypothetical protein